MDPTERKDCETELLQTYVNQFVKTRVEMSSNKNMEDKDSTNEDISMDSAAMWDYCWREYKIGGVERWIWFLVYFVGSGLNDWAQFFHDQLSSFMKDHELTEADITQPRP